MSVDSLRKNLVGVSVAMPAFYNSDLSVDLEAVASHTRFVVESGIRNGDGLLICNGAGGEGPHLTDEEQAEVAKAMVVAANDEVPVVVGVCDTSTLRAVRLAKQAEHHGAHGLQIAPPFYYGHSGEEVFRYVKAVSDEVSIGIMLYNLPLHCPDYFDVEFVSRCLDLGNIVGIKWYSNNRKTYRNMYETLLERVNIIDNMLFCCGPLGFIMGACGFPSQTANFAPQKDLAVLKLLREKRYEEAYKKMTDLIFPYYDLIDDFTAEGISGRGTM